MGGDGQRQYLVGLGCEPAKNIHTAEITQQHNNKIGYKIENRVFGQKTNNQKLCY